MVSLLMHFAIELSVAGYEVESRLIQGALPDEAYSCYNDSTPLKKLLNGDEAEYATRYSLAPTSSLLQHSSMGALSLSAATPNMLPPTAYSAVARKRPAKDDLQSAPPQPRVKHARGVPVSIATDLSGVEEDADSRMD